MLKKLINKYRTTTDLNRFLIIGGSLFLVWRVFRKWMLLEGQYLEFTNIWAKAYLNIAGFVLSVFGYDTSTDFSLNKLWLTGASQAIEIVYGCLGVNLLFIFMIFIMAYPGKLKIKIWFIPAGICLLFILNALRMAALAVVAANKYHLLDLYHHFILQGVIYIIIFALCWWFSVINKKAITTNKSKQL
jgi:exosortase/archaeosortase family protein